MCKGQLLLAKISQLETANNQHSVGTVKSQPKEVVDPRVGIFLVPLNSDDLLFSSCTNFTFTTYCTFAGDLTLLML